MTIKKAEWNLFSNIRLILLETGHFGKHPENCSPIAEKIIQEIRNQECEHPYIFVNRKGDYEKCLKCKKVLCEG
jgi:hypothetical protein